MIAKERQQQIIKLLEQQQVVTIQYLSEYFSVAVITVRRDLDALAKAGLIEKTYGGASLPAGKLYPAQTNTRYSSRAVDSLKEKQAIAAMASELITPGETVFLDTGTTVSELAKLIKHRTDITVVTNSLAVVNELMDSSIRFFCVGGWIEREQLLFTANGTDSYLDNFCFSHYFCGAGGVSVQTGVTNFCYDSIYQRKAVLARSASSVLLTDSKKFEVTAPFVTAPLSAFHTLITDSNISGKHRNELLAAGIGLLIAAPSGEIDA